MIDIYVSESARYTSHDSPNVANLARIVQMPIPCGYPHPIRADLDLDVDTKVVSADEDMSQSAGNRPWTLYMITNGYNETWSKICAKNSTLQRPFNGIVVGAMALG